MAVPRKFVVVPSPATRDLWRFVESGEIDKFEVVLPCAEINARNEHGTTALMRASRHGCMRMVRALLEHGADPNLVRNDNFTALSLAAFFGYAEIVELLVKHGARTDVATRNGTSPHMWATARSFGEVAKCLEKRGDQKKPVAPIQPVSRQPVSPPTATAPVEVRTLHDPPEIWDLVHEAPQNFTPGSAFVARVGSLRKSFVFGVVVLLLVIGTGAWFWKGAWKLNKADKPTQAAFSLPAAPVQAAAPVVEPPATSVDPPTPAVEPATDPTADVTIAAPVSVPRRSRSVARSRSIESNPPPVNTIEPAPAPPPPTPVAKSVSTTESVTKNKPATPMSQQMISPPKTTQPKAKVIQWP